MTIRLLKHGYVQQRCLYCRCDIKNCIRIILVITDQKSMNWPDRLQDVTLNILQVGVSQKTMIQLGKKQQQITLFFFVICSKDSNIYSISSSFNYFGT